MIRIVAWALAVVALVTVALDTIVVSVAGSLWSMSTIGIHGWPLVDLAAAGCSVLGTVIVTRHPRHVIGWLLVGLGVTTSISLLTESYSAWVLDEGGPGSTLTGELSAWISYVLGGTLALSVLAVILATVPDGHVLSRRWRPVVWTAILGYAFSLTSLLITSPSDVAAAADGIPTLSAVSVVLASVGIILTAGSIVAAVVSMVVRLRRSQGEAKQQLRWVVSAAIFLAAALVVVIVEQSLSDGQQSPITSVALFLSYVVLMASIAISALRYRLWDLDIIISRAVALTCATAFVTAAYAVLVVAVGERLDGNAAGFGLSLAITAVVSLAFQPLRGWVVRLADRLAYGSRAEPYDALAEFSRRAGACPLPDQLLPAVAEAAGLASSAMQVAVRLDLPDGSDASVAWTPRSPSRESPGEWVEVPVVDTSGPVGSIRVLLPAARNLRAHERRLVHDIAQQAAVAFANARLEAALAAHVEELDRQTAELAASRARLIHASDSGRHRLEASISQQVLPRLLALRDALSAAPAEGPTVEQAEAYVDEATAALESLRDLTKGLHPTLLNRSGLASALASYVTRSGTGASLVVAPEAAATRWPAAVEAAAYFCCTQVVALGGVRTIRISQSSDVLEIDLVGSCLDVTVRQSMIDRIETLCGSLTDSPEGMSIRLPRSTELSPTERSVVSVG